MLPRRTVSGMRATLRASCVFALLLATVLSVTTVPAQAAGTEGTGGKTNAGSNVNRSGGSASVSGSARQDDITGAVPWCVTATGGGGFYDPTPTRNDNYFLAPFVGCGGNENGWTVNMKNCFTGYMVWRFYGTLRAGDQTRVVTRSRVEVPRWCGEGYEQNADFFFPNATDATGSPATTVDGNAADFAYKVFKSTQNNRTVVQTSELVNTTGTATKLRGSCTKPLTSLENWFQASIKDNAKGARETLYDRYQATRRATGSAQTARLDINAIDMPRSAEDIRFGSVGDCSSIFDYQGFIPTGTGQQYATASEIPASVIRDNTVVVGTCAIPLERPARVYKGRNNYAYYTDKVADGKLGERYSMAPFPYGLADDNVIKSYKAYVKTSAFGKGLPLTPMAWPSTERIGKYGSSAWKRNEVQDPERLAQYVRCDYQSLAPQTDLIGCERTGTCKNPADTTRNDSTTRVRNQGVDADVYVEVTATLPRYYTASGELKVFRVPTTGQPLCRGGRVCGTERLDPRIVSWTYSTQLVGNNGYRACTKKGQRSCDWFSEVAGRNGTITASFYSPTAKGESVELVVTRASVTYIPKEERVIERCQVVTTTDGVTGEETSETVCWTETIIVELPPRTSEASLLLPGDAARTVTGSVGS